MQIRDGDLRWKKRFQNFENARTHLYNLCYAYQKNRFDSNLQTQFIHSFEFTFKLAWKTVKDFLIFQGVRDVEFPREVVKKGFSYRIIEDGQMWIDIIEDQALITYTTDKESIGKAVTNITSSYLKALDQVYFYFRKKSKAIEEFGLPAGVLKRICDLFSEYGEIDEVKIYGSRALGTCDHTSDIDLAFYTKSNKHLTKELQKRLDGLPTPYLFDLTNYYRINHKPLQKSIDRVGITIFKGDK